MLVSGITAYVQLSCVILMMSVAHYRLLMLLILLLIEFTYCIYTVHCYCHVISCHPCIPCIRKKRLQLSRYNFNKYWPFF